MGKSVKIRTLAAPQTPLSEFDPGEFLSGLEFYETDSKITEEDRDGMAQFAHFLAFLALQGESSKWADSTVGRGTLAYQALESHFCSLVGWQELTENERGINYQQLASFLMGYYPPRSPE
jgi:hypothetical protein